jgi:sugar phosphate isomerase/epimerase
MTNSLSRRAFLAVAAAAPASFAWGTPADKKVPLGLELYSVRNELAKDLFGTVRAVAKMGYEGVEWPSTYYSWNPEYAKEVRKLLDDLKLPCFATHNNAPSFTPEGIPKAIELNSILGAKYIVMASAGRVQDLDGWKAVADRLNQAAEKMKSAGLQPGYHNHAPEFTPIDNVRPIEVVARNTSKDVMLQLDVGTCVQAGSDPIAWIEANPGRIRSVHCKDWSPEAGKGYRVLFGEGASPWKKIFEVAEKTGGVEFYLIEQEGSSYPEAEAAERCLANFRKTHA